MKKDNIILSVAVIFIIIVVGICVYYFAFSQQKSVNSPAANTNIKAGGQVVVPLTPAQQAEQIKKEYPEVITGTINFLDTKTSWKSTIKTDNGNVYTLWPLQPESVYASYGAKDGGRVEIQAKAPENGEIEWGTMKPI